MITKLRVQNFRKHADLTVEFHPGMTVITGANGSGKTSLIEAIYIALQGKSWRSNFVEILRDEQQTSNWWRVDVELANEEQRTVKFADGVKTFAVGAQTATRLPTRQKKPVILFEPNDLQLLYGSPTRRRDFLDRFITQIEPAHATSLRKFERVLRQRNNLLKQGAAADELFVWDLQFADLAEKIIAARTKWTKEINDNLTPEYQKIASSDDVATIKYSTPQKTRQQILSQLHQDLAAHWPFTKAGPQTHDIRIKINSHDAKATASRGENRTIIFAILATMTGILNRVLGEKVYLLLDDIDSELDAARRNQLYKLETFNNNYLLATTIKHSGGAVNNIKLAD